MMLFVAALLLAQAVPAPCAGTIDANLPAPLAGWTAPGSEVAVGKAALLDTKGNSGSTAPRSAEAIITITKAGTYGIALDQKGWIDLYATVLSPALKSVSHREGDPCWSIRKIVRFDLQPGAYRLLISKLDVPRVKVMLEQGE